MLNSGRQPYESGKESAMQAIAQTLSRFFHSSGANFTLLHLEEETSPASHTFKRRSKGVNYENKRGPFGTVRHVSSANAFLCFKLEQ
jgi:hypothetical protein